MGSHIILVRQLLFAPLWDSGALRWFSGCFVFNNSNVHIFSRDTELNFVMAFNNSVMAEGLSTCACFDLIDCAND